MLKINPEPAIKNLFVLEYSYYEEYYAFYFEGPENVTRAQFKATCNELLEKAGYNAIVAERKDEYPSFVGWRHVVESMVPLLEQQGYRCFMPKRASFWGGGIIDNYDDAHALGKAGPEIVNYNRKRREDLMNRK